MQLELSALHENVTTMGARLGVYPWVQMVVFSELAPYGPLLSKSVAFPAPAEEIFRSWAAAWRNFERFEEDEHLVDYEDAAVISSRRAS